uniref:Uncharacterized protein n=1 Tax=Rhizophora mucronata TaxID=61149 RepID=A0A2P2R1H2_RHIMU
MLVTIYSTVNLILHFIIVAELLS